MLLGYCQHCHLGNIVKIEHSCSTSGEYLSISYLTANQQTLAHISHSDHQTGQTIVGRHHRMLAKLHRFPSLLGPSHLSRKSH